MRRPRRVLPLLLAAVLVPVAIPAAAGTAHAETPVRCQKVGVIGGSITVGSATTQGQEFVDLGILDFRFDAKVGRQITRPKTGGIITLQRMRASGYDPDCLVIALGTNDFPYHNSSTVYRGWIDKMMVAIGPTPRVLWINVYRSKSVFTGHVFNAQLNAATADYANLQIADWSTLAATHASWLSKDGVHPVGGGILARSKWVALQVQEKLNGGDPADGRPLATCTVVTVPLQRKMKGADVMCLEQRLRQLRYFTKTADTKFEYSTATTLSAWQKRHGLTVTGIVDDATRAALGLSPPPVP